MVAKLDLPADLDDRADDAPDSDVIDYEDPVNYGAENAVYLVTGPTSSQRREACGCDQCLFGDGCAAVRARRVA